MLRLRGGGGAGGAVPVCCLQVLLGKHTIQSKIVKQKMLIKVTILKIMKSVIIQNEIKIKITKNKM